jgi:hypothetical protein
MLGVMFDSLARFPEARRLRLRPLLWWWVAASAVLVVGVGVATGWWLWILSDGLPEADLIQARAVAIRTGLTAAGGTGAALALLLAVRRQRSTEIALHLQDADLAQKKQAAEEAQLDARERRITELYIKAVEQLGSDKAPVRLGALHALERLAQDNEAHRQPIVDVICAYLRMPYTPPGPPFNRAGEVGSAACPPDQNVNRDEVEASQRFEHREQERQVRQAAQRVLTVHLCPYTKYEQDVNSKFWPDIEVDLTGAFLIDFNLSHCQVPVLTLNGATLAGETLFRATECDTAFVQNAAFVRGVGIGSFAADFRGAHFTIAWFSYATFAGTAWFHADQFFPGPRFGHASFKSATFSLGACFDGASFNGSVDLEGARTLTGPDIPRIWPVGWTERPTSQASEDQDGDEAKWACLTRVTEDHGE